MCVLWKQDIPKPDGENHENRLNRCL
jgi:hypothetical protein